ncbi:MAG: hypothetical protein IT203_06510, partial [Fimbriimonadaceae bacterium]|nr:hypothetical protein [Fimbriimonadaceae bacterium]
GMENVSATILGEGSLPEARDGYFTMDSLTSHELGHQWFGDLVTCKDWGDTWLNESFATYMEMIYMEHRGGKDAYAWEIDGAMKSYFAEARRYRRPISTKMYANADAMFDSHTYPKGGVVLHTLRRKLGDEAFYAGLNFYLNKWRHSPVESAQLRRAFTEATGINVEPFWAQWFEKPGHPVLEYTWTYDDAAKEVVVDVKQTQDTSDGTPIYDLPTTFGLIGSVAANGTASMSKVDAVINAKEQQIRLKSASRPKAVVLDPFMDYLREIRHEFDADELAAVLAGAPSAPDRAAAMTRLLANPSDDSVRLVVANLERDKNREPAFMQVGALANLARPELRSFWLNQLSHANLNRQAQAVSALAKLPSDPGTVAKLRLLINDKSGIQVVVNAINALAGWDAKANADIFQKAVNIKDRRNRIKRAAETALGK